MFSYRTIDEYTKGVLERQFYDFFILRQPDLTLEKVKMQESEVQSVKLCTMSELRTLNGNNELVKRDAVYAALEEYISSLR